LFIALDQRRLFLQGGKSGKPQSMPLNDFTLLLATTDEYKLLQPLRDRMILVLRFEFYSGGELVELVRQRCKALKWAVDDNVLTPIASRSRGTPRLALRLLQSARRVARSEGEDNVTLDHLERACGLEQIDPLGLGPTEKAYLLLLADGASRLNVIASRLGLPSRTVAEVSEPFLLRAGLVMKDDQGRRQLTADGVRNNYAPRSTGRHSYQLIRVKRLQMIMHEEEDGLRW
jgi:Holliday junction DNA helicase RuvB